MKQVSKRITKECMVSAAMIGFLGLLVGLTCLNFFLEKRQSDGSIVREHLALLHKTFKKIDATCGILSFDKQQNTINFLNVGTFSGSEVGPMNLVYPDKWEGPYLPDNPTMQGIEYLVVRTKADYFITPGNDVRLPNDEVVGEDIVLSEDADIASLANDPDGLSFDGKPLAIKLDLARG